MECFIQDCSFSPLIFTILKKTDLPAETMIAEDSPNGPGSVSASPSVHCCQQVVSSKSVSIFEWEYTHVLFLKWEDRYCHMGCATWCQF